MSDAKKRGPALSPEVTARLLASKALHTAAQTFARRKEELHTANDFEGAETALALSEIDLETKAMMFAVAADRDKAYMSKIRRLT